MRSKRLELALSDDELVGMWGGTTGASDVRCEQPGEWWRDRQRSQSGHKGNAGKVVSEQHRPRLGYAVGAGQPAIPV